MKQYSKFKFKNGTSLAIDNQKIIVISAFTLFAVIMLIIIMKFIVPLLVLGGIIALLYFYRRK